MKRMMTSFLFIVFCFLLQCTVFQALNFGGIIPNLMVVVTASYGFMRGRKDGLWVGFFSGLLIDIFYGSVLGFYALIYMYIGYLNGAFRKIFYPEDIKLPLALILGSDLLYNMVCYILLFLLRGRFRIGYYFLNIMVPEMVYTIVVTFVLYPLLLFVERRLELAEKKGLQKDV